MSARENGQDVTERERRKEAGADDHRRGSASRWSLDETLAPPLPFLAPGGARYRLGLEAGKGTRLVYHPAEATELRVASGWVELDAADGLPLRHQFVPAPLPKMIHSLVTTVSYRRSAGMALPESTESVGEGGFLFIRKRFRVRMTYRDWELAPLR